MFALFVSVYEKQKKTREREKEKQSWNKFSKRIELNGCHIIK